MQLGALAFELFASESLIQQSLIQEAGVPRVGPWMLGGDAVELSPHGGDLNGFILIQGESAQLDAVVSSEEWLTAVSRSGLILEGVGVVRGATGDVLMESMARWSSLIPTSPI